jgi:hypothetical protein
MAIVLMAAALRIEIAIHNKQKRKPALGTHQLNGYRAV